MLVLFYGVVVDAHLLDFIVNGVLYWILVALVVLQLYNLIVHRDVPNIRSAPAIRKEVIDFLKKDFAERKTSPYVVIDLGSGNGLFTREIAKAMPEAKVVGIEIARHTFAWAEWMRRRQGINNLEYKRMNYFDYDVLAASAVIIYQIPFYMNRIGKKLNEETRKDTLIISNKFKLGDGWVPVESKRIKTLYFHQKDLHIYRKL